MDQRMRRMIGLAIASALALPAAAQAATKTVTMGEPSKTQRMFEDKYGTDVDAFFPSRIAVHVGDSVKFVPVSFHTVHFLGKSGKAAPVVIASKKLIAGVTDAAGVPFGFNGKPELNFNPIFFAPGKLGKTVVTDGTKQFSSGLPFAEHPKPMTVRFTKAGLFRYICDVHAGMKGSVRVAPAITPVPSAGADAKRVSTQVRKAIAVSKSFKTVTPPAKTVNVGMFGRGGVSLFDFVPHKLSVPVGTTVTFRSVGRNPEIHTATTGPGDPEKDPKSYLGRIAKSFEQDNQPPQIGANPSDGGAAALLSSALHGNGFWNAGILDDVSLTTVLPNRQQVTVAQAGTYKFYCLIHPFMQVTITAQ